MKKWIVLFLLSGMLTGCGSQTADKGLMYKKTAEGISIMEGETPVLFYRKTAPLSENEAVNAKSRAHYIHPLYDLDGNIITQDAPGDHYHHHGVFWAWHQIWVGDSLIGDSWDIRDWQWKVDSCRVTKGEGGALLLHTNVQWQSPRWKNSQAEMAPLIKETTVMTIHPKAEGCRAIDFDIQLLALEQNMKIGGADNIKEYSGFSIRVNMPDDLQFNGQTGPLGPVNTPVDGGAWVDFSGTLTEGSAPAGVTIMCHPDSPQYPQPWILRRKGSMQNVVWPGRAPQPLSATGPVEFKYRLVVHQGEFDQQQTEKMFTLYKK